MSSTYLIIDTESYREDDKSWSVKIGRSRNPRGRMAGFKTANPGKLHLAATLPGGDWERLLHATLTRFRGNGEWFRLDIGRILLVMTLADEHPEGWVDFDLKGELPNPCMQSADDSCLLEADAFLEGWDVGEAYERSKVRAA